MGDYLYYTQTNSRTVHRRVPPGRLNANRLIKGAAAWQLPSQPRLRKRKTLIYTIDRWARRSPSLEYLERIIKNLLKFIENGFDIYFWNVEKLQLITKDNVDKIEHYLTRLSMQKMTDEMLVQAAIKQLSLGLDEVAIISYPTIHHENLLKNPDRSLIYLTEILTFPEEERYAYIDSLQNSMRANSLFFICGFSKEAQDLIYYIQERLPKSSFKMASYFSIATLTTDQVHKLINNQSISFWDNRDYLIEADQFRRAYEIFLLEANTPKDDILKLLRSMPELYHLTLKHKELTPTACFTAAPTLKNVTLNGKVYINHNSKQSDPSAPYKANCQSSDATKIGQKQQTQRTVEETEEASTEKNEEGLSSVKDAEFSEDNISVDEEISNSEIKQNITSSDSQDISTSSPTEDTHAKHTNPSFDASKYKEKSANNSAIRSDTKNQGMIIKKLSRYLQIINKDIDIIPELQNGICLPLSYHFIESSTATWERFIKIVSEWNEKKDTLTPELTKNLNKLYAQVVMHHFGRVLFQAPAQYCGDNLGEFLTRANKPYILSNPWHAIGIKPTSNPEQWVVYDPNYTEADRLVDTKEMVDTIHQSLGHCVSVYSYSPKVYPLVNDKDKFLADGGLITLCQLTRTSTPKILQQVQGHKFKKKSLDSILLRTNEGIPAWVIGVENSITIKFTIGLLQQFIKQNPEDYLTQLQKSMELLAPQQKSACIGRIIQYSLQNKLEYQIDKIVKVFYPQINSSSSPEAILSSNQFATWEREGLQIDSLDEFKQHCVKPGKVKKRLIECKSTEDVQALQLALQTSPRPVFSVNSPEDLLCAAPYIERQDDDTGLIKKGPGGPLYDFLKEHQDKQPIIVVNYENFYADDIVRFNSLLDDTRRADGTFLPEGTLIVGLTNTNSPDCYEGADFYSRFDKVEVCPLTSEQLETVRPALPTSETPARANHPNFIDLYHAPDWKERLLGRWTLDGDVLKFEPGVLEGAIAKGTPIHIQNGLWDDPEFKYFWEDAYTQGRIKCNGNSINFPKDTVLKRNDGYEWESLQRAQIVQIAAEPFTPPTLVLNPMRLGELFNSYKCDNKTGQLFIHESLLEKHAGETISVHLTRTLSEDEWAMLLVECRKHRVKLNTFVVPGAKLPEVWNIESNAINPTVAWDKTSQYDTVIATTDIDATVAIISDLEHPDVVIDISECMAADLLECIDGKLIEETLRFRFQHTTRAVLNALEKNQTVILKGKFSEELIDELAALMLKRAPDAKGKLILVTEDATQMQFASVKQHSVTAEEKRRLIKGELHPKLEELLDKEPLSQLKARQNFLKNNSHADSSDEAWLGLLSLPHGLNNPGSLNLETSQIDAEKYIAQRAQSVNHVLSYAPYVFIAGLSGVGKSTFVENDLCTEEDELYQGEVNIKRWAQDKSSKRKILFIDEANLSQREWSEFEGLYNCPSSILIDGEVIELSPEHKVVFAGNPVSYGSERSLAPFFKRHGNAVVFEPLSPAVIYERILAPVFQGTLHADYAAEISSHILKVYEYLCKCSTDTVLISPRELQMMALLSVARSAQNHDLDINDISQYYAWNLAKDLVPASHTKKFNGYFKPNSMLPYDSVPNEYTKLNDKLEKPFHITDSRKPIAQKLEDLLHLRALRQQGRNDAQKYGGLGGIVLEGDPGIGKTELVMALLNSRGTPVYQIPVSMSPDDKETLLLKAFDEGAVVVIDEINSSPMMERLLNDLLMGKSPEGKRPSKPGFFVIGTQNPVTMAGRRAPSTALSRRLITTTLPPYSSNEMLTILQEKGLAFTRANALVQSFNTKLEYAKQNHLQQAPNFRHLLRAADDLIAIDTAYMPKDLIATDQVIEIGQYNKGVLLRHMARLLSNFAKKVAHMESRARVNADCASMAFLARYMHNELGHINADFERESIDKQESFNIFQHRLISLCNQIESTGVFASELDYGTPVLRELSMILNALLNAIRFVAIKPMKVIMRDKTPVFANGIEYTFLHSRTNAADTFNLFRHKLNTVCAAAG